MCGSKNVFKRFTKTLACQSTTWQAFLFYYMEGKKSFVLYTDQREVFDELSDAEAGKLIKHIFSYVNDENPITEDILIKVAFLPIKTQLKRDLKIWDERKQLRSEAGKKGGLAKASNATEILAKASNATNDVANLAVNVNVNENVNVNVNDISSLTIFTTSRLGGKNLFQEMMYIYDLNEEQVQKLFQEWDLTHDDQTFESERHLKNSFILFVKNNAARFKQSITKNYKQNSTPKSENVFSKLLAEEIEKENQIKS